MYQFDMTDEEVKRAHAAARLVKRLASNKHLSDALTVGEQLLKGRTYAMKSAGANKPNGRKYAEAYQDWKTLFGFPGGKEYNALYDHAIVCAQHRPIAEEVMAGLGSKERMGIGIFGLAKRVRRRVDELEGIKRKAPPRPSMRSEIEAVQGEMADVREELAAARAEAPEKHWRHDPETVGAQMAKADAAAFRRLVAAGQKVLGD